MLLAQLKPKTLESNYMRSDFATKRIALVGLLVGLVSLFGCQPNISLRVAQRSSVDNLVFEVFNYAGTERGARIHQFEVIQTRVGEPWSEASVVWRIRSDRSRGVSLDSIRYGSTPYGFSEDTAAVRLQAGLPYFASAGGLAVEFQVLSDGRIEPL
jgi:hypothetical protein